MNEPVASSLTPQQAEEHFLTLVEPGIPLSQMVQRADGAWVMPDE